MSERGPNAFCDATVALRSQRLANTEAVTRDLNTRSYVRMPCCGHEAGFPRELPSTRLSPRNLPSSSQHERTLRVCGFALMSHSSPTAVSSSNFQSIINNALKVYKKRTRKDLLSLPLTSEFQACNSSAAVLAVLQQRVQGSGLSRGHDDRRTKWLVSTVKVLYTLSATLEERVGLVSPRI